MFGGSGFSCEEALQQLAAASQPLSNPFKPPSFPSRRSRAKKSHFQTFVFVSLTCSSCSFLLQFCPLFPLALFKHWRTAAGTRHELHKRVSLLSADSNHDSASLWLRLFSEPTLDLSISRCHKLPSVTIFVFLFFFQALEVAFLFVTTEQNLLCAIIYELAY